MRRRFGHLALVLALPGLVAVGAAGALPLGALLPTGCGEFVMAAGLVQGERLAFRLDASALALADVSLDGFRLLGEVRPLAELRDVEAQVDGDRFRARADLPGGSFEAEALDCGDAALRVRSGSAVQVRFTLPPGGVVVPWDDEAVFTVADAHVGFLSLYDGAAFAERGLDHVVVGLPAGGSADFCNLDAASQFECESGPIVPQLLPN